MNQGQVITQSQHVNSPCSSLPRASRRYQADVPSSSAAALMLSDDDGPACRAFSGDAAFSPKHAQRQQQSASNRGAAFSPQRRGSRPPTRRRFQVQADASLNTLFGWERQGADMKRP